MQTADERIGRSASTDHSIRVAFFLGSDITSHLIANRLLPILLDSGISVRLYLTRASANADRPEPLRHLFFVEHTLLQEHAYPYADLHGTPRSDGFNTPNGWLALAPDRVQVREVEDVNTPEFIAELEAEQIDVTVCIRCYQKFGVPILSTLAAHASIFVNLHPGLLPRYQGVNTFLRSMAEGAEQAGFTLHHLEEDWDTGAVIGQARFPLSYSDSVSENMITHAADAASLILGTIERVAAGLPVESLEQDSSKARYFSYPTTDDLDKLTDDGIDVFSASTVIDTLADAFFGTVPDIAKLRQVLIDAVEKAGIPCEYSPGEQGVLDPEPKP